MRQSREIVLNAADASTNQTSAAINCQYVLQASAQAVVTGTATGTVKFQASNDFPVASGSTPTNWTDIASMTVAIAGAGTYLIPKFDVCYEWMRIVYTFASNTGAITVQVKTNGA